MLNKRFTFLCNQEDRQLLRTLSEHLRRSQGNAIRFLIRAAISELMIDPNRFSLLNTGDGMLAIPKDNSSDRPVGSDSSEHQTKEEVDNESDA